MFYYQLKEQGEKNHEILFLPLFTGCNRGCFGPILVATDMG
jgi:hypothetical protein